jgi:hypothetical protein
VSKYPVLEVVFTPYLWAGTNITVWREKGFPQPQMYRNVTLASVRRMAIAATNHKWQDRGWHRKGDSWVRED